MRRAPAPSSGHPSIRPLLSAAGILMPLIRSANSSRCLLSSFLPSFLCSCPTSACLPFAAAVFLLLHTRNSCLCTPLSNVASNSISLLACFDSSFLSGEQWLQLVGVECGSREGDRARDSGCCGCSLVACLHATFAARPFPASDQVMHGAAHNQPATVPLSAYASALVLPARALHPSGRVLRSQSVR